MREWLLSLPKLVRQRIGKDIFKVQVQGLSVGKPLVDGFGDGLYEVRSSYDGEKYRVLFYIEAGTIVVVHAQGTMVVVHGIHKKTQKTPQADIALARKRMKEGT